MPNIRITASTVRQDIPNNRTLVRLTMRLHSTYRLNVPSPPTKHGSLNGQAFSYSKGSIGSGSWVLRTRDVWVPHNSDGTKTYSYSGWYNLNITYSGRWIGRLNAPKGSITLKRIPRQSTLTSASIGASLKPNTANKVTVDISSQTSFGHWFDVMYGSTRIRGYTNTGKPSEIPLTATHVNDILDIAKSATNPTLTVRMTTRDGNTQIGSTVSRSFSAAIHSDVRPAISNFETSIHGTGVDATTFKDYVQGISRVSNSFTRSPGYGASIVESKITVERTNGTNRQIISSTSGVTETAVTSSGNYRAIAYTRDSRGRTATSTNDFTVIAYSQPSIDVFTAERPGEKGSIVNTLDSGTFSRLGGRNKLRVIVDYKGSSASDWTIIRDVVSTSGTFGNTARATEVGEGVSHTFRLTISDSFGKGSTTERSIGTAKTTFAINKNLGVGIGKRHEQGALDVAGDLFVNGVNISEFKTSLPEGDGSNEYWLSMGVGRYVCSPNTFTSQPYSYGFVDVMGFYEEPRDRTVVFYGRGNQRNNVYSISINALSPEGLARDWVSMIPDSSENRYGNYTKFADGTAIVGMNATGNITNGRNTVEHTLPIPLYKSYFTAHKRSSYVSTDRLDLFRIVESGNNRIVLNIDTNADTSYSVWIIGYGRWKL